MKIRLRGNAGLTAYCFILAVCALGLVGWVLNIAKIMHMEVLNGFAIVRAIGVFIAPLGAILGYL